MSYCIPYQSSEIFKGKEAWSNAGLVFDRFAPDLSDNPGQVDSLKKDGLLDVLASAANPALPTLRHAVHARWKAAVTALGAKVITLKTDWRFVSGVGRNTAMRLAFDLIVMVLLHCQAVASRE